ncbi:MAG: IS4 family transposase [Blastocatellia bacterium]
MRQVAECIGTLHLGGDDGRTSVGCIERQRQEARESNKAEEKKVSARNKPASKRKRPSAGSRVFPPNALAKEMPSTHPVCVMDREADCYELFREPRHRQVDLLVGARHDRWIEGDTKLLDMLRQDSVRGTLNIRIPRQRASAANRANRRHAPKRDERTVQVSLRYREIELLPSSYWKDRSPLQLSVIHLLEENPPAGETPLEWFLLTTIPVTDNHFAERCVGWVRLRWRIEDWHRVLKSGCGAEALAHKTGERLKRGIAIKLVIAWRIMRQ